MTTRHVKASDIASEYGMSARHWIRLAKAGKIPGAWQPAGPRGHWLFDAVAFEEWRKASNREVGARPGYTVGEVSIGRAPSVTVESTGEASRRKIEQLASAVLGIGSPTSKRSSSRQTKPSRK